MTASDFYARIKQCDAMEDQKERCQAIAEFTRAGLNMCEPHKNKAMSLGQILVSNWAIERARRDGMGW